MALKKVVPSLHPSALPLLQYQPFKVLMSLCLVSYPVTVSSRQHLLDEDCGTIGLVGTTSDGDTQTAGSRH